MENLKNLCVDSDILIDYLRGLENARDFFISSFSEWNFCISVISIAEIYSGKGMASIAHQKDVLEFLENFSALPVTPEIAKLAGEIRRDSGKPFADALIRGIKDLKIFSPY